MTIELGHLQVGNDECRLFHALEHLDGFSAVGGRLHRKTLFFKVAAHGMPDQHGIIHNKNNLAHNNTLGGEVTRKLSKAYSGRKQEYSLLRYGGHMSAKR